MTVEDLTVVDHEARPGVSLWLDDVRDPPDDRWTVVRTAEEAKAILASGPVEVASLDHDMGECEECVNSFPRRAYRLVTGTCRHRMTGYDLVAWMVATGTWPRRKPAVHSESERGRVKMIAEIEEHWRPS